MPIIIEASATSVALRYKPETIKSILEERGIPWERWGTGMSRSFQQFMELLNEHPETTFDASGTNLLVTLRTAVICVYYYTESGEIHELIETGQTKVGATGDDAKPLVRGFPGSVGEGMKVIDKNSWYTARRGLLEELKFKHTDYSLTLCPVFTHTSRVMQSEKWPGINCVYQRDVFGCFISDKIYEAKGYIAVDNGWEVSFKWDKARTIEETGDGVHLIWNEAGVKVRSQYLTEYLRHLRQSREIRS